MIDSRLRQASDMEGFPIDRKIPRIRLAAAAPVLVAAAFAAACRRAAPAAHAQTLPRTPSSAEASSAPDRHLPLLPAPDPGYGFTPAEKAAVDQYLAKHASLRIATDDDARSSDESSDMSKLYGIYHPYFVRGDVDDDGILDFVIGFVDRTKASAPWFTVVVFRANGRGGFLPAAELEREVSLENGDLAVDRDSILVTPDLSQDSGRRYRWNPRHSGFDFVSDDDSSGSDHEPSNLI